MDIIIEKGEARNNCDHAQNFGFGKVFTPHMFEADYSADKGWHNAKISPFHNLSLSPAAMIFHYGQEMFEGLKAYRAPDGVRLFRPDMNAKRAIKSCERMSLPVVPEEDFVSAVKALVGVDYDCVPEGDGNALYIRPFIIATDEFLGAERSKTYKFLIIASPSGTYYSTGLSPVKIRIEDEYVRAVRGGTGFAKTGGNYAGAMISQDKAHKEGFAQVLWLDGVERKYVEEVGSMNIFFKISGKIVTPALSGGILAGITRDSVLTLAREYGYEAVERRVSVDELISDIRSGECEEAFGTGTAAVIQPVGELGYKGELYRVADGTTGQFTKRVYEHLCQIQRGKEQYKNWSVLVDRI